MIKGVHAMFYAPNAEELRAFFRDKLGLVWSDVGGGWLIFDVPEAEFGCHPADRRFEGFSFYCDDVHATVAELSARGVEFEGEVQDRGYGLIAVMKLPGGGTIEVYQPLYGKHQAG